MPQSRGRRSERRQRHQRRHRRQRERGRHHALVEALVGGVGEDVGLVALGAGEAEGHRQQHVAGLAYGGGKVGVRIVGGEALQRGAALVVGGERRSRRRRGRARLGRDALLRLGEEQVEHRRLGVRLGEAAQRGCEEVAAERPAAERGDAGVIDQHHRDLGAGRTNPA